MFTGREWAAGQWATVNPPLGFYEYRARAYNPTLGRFMSEDPKLFDAGDYNLFRYCHNDPEDHTDPMGLEDIQISEEMDRLGAQASLNSLRAALAAGDHIARMQLVQAAIHGSNQGRPVLQNRFYTGEMKTESRREPTGELARKGSGFTTNLLEGKAKADPGYKALAPGHVHLDVTGKPNEGSDFSKYKTECWPQVRRTSRLFLSTRLTSLIRAKSCDLHHKLTRMMHQLLK